MNISSVSLTAGFLGGFLRIPVELTSGLVSGTSMGSLGKRSLGERPVSIAKKEINLKQSFVWNAIEYIKRMININPPKFA